MHTRKSTSFKVISHPKLLVTKMAQPERSEKNITKVTLKVAKIFGQLRWFVLVRITNVLRLERPRVETQVQWTHVRYLTAKPVRYPVDRLLIGFKHDWTVQEAKNVVAQHGVQNRVSDWSWLQMDSCPLLFLFLFCDQGSVPLKESFRYTFR